ncbi:MAG: HGGxSTG domain-containing protein [Burkholderiaceae bacterium]
MRQKIKCGAYARTTGNPCQAKALTDGRCVRHGGASTGAKTLEGRNAIAEATRQRMASGQQERVLAGFYRWLEGGGREMLSRLAKNREKRKRWERLMHKQQSTQNRNL